MVSKFGVGSPRTKTICKFDVWPATSCSLKDLKEDITLGELRVSMHWNGPDHFPCLKTKAAETKHLVHALLCAFEKLMAPGDEQHKLVLLLLKLAARIESIMDVNKDEYVLSPVVAEDWKKTCQAFVLANAKLGHYYHPRKIMLFHFTIKFHYLCHIALLGRRLNPRVAWCYCGENMMQVCKAIVQSSHLGSPPPVVVNKVMTKYARGLSLKCAGNVWLR